MSWPAANGGAAASADAPGLTGYFALSQAADITAAGPYAAEAFFYLRTRTASETNPGQIQFGQFVPALTVPSADTLNLTTAVGSFGVGGYTTLAFTSTNVDSNGVNQFYYLRQDSTGTGNTILGRLNPSTAAGVRTISDIANLGSTFNTLVFVTGATFSGADTNRFYTTGLGTPPANAQSISFAAIANQATGVSFTVTPSASSTLPIVLTVVSSSTGSATIASGPGAGVFTVMPTSPGIVTLQATQSGGASLTNWLQQSFNVPGPVTTQAIPSTVLTVNTLAVPFTPVTVAVGTDGSPIFSVLSTPVLPAGLTINNTTGLISGTPTVGSGPTSYTVTATDSNGVSSSKTFSLTVTAQVAQAALTLAPLTAQDFGTSRTFTVGGGSGTGAITDSLASGPATRTAALTYTADSGTTGYTVSVTKAADANFFARTDTFAVPVAKAAATVTLGSLNPTYDGIAKAATATTTPAGLTVTFTYDGGAAAPTAGGSYAVVGTINDLNYVGTASGTLVIAQATQAALTLTPLTAQTYGTSRTFTVGGGNGSGAITDSLASGPATRTAALTYTADSGTTGYTISVTKAADANYLARTDTFAVPVAKAAATVALGSLSPTYNGTAKAATATTTPAGLTVTFTYDGGAAAPTAGGSYAVVGTITDANYAGSASGTLVIAQATQAALTLTPLTAHTYGTSRTFTVGGGSGSGAITDSLVIGGVATRTAALVYTANSGTTGYTVSVTKAADASYLARTDTFAVTVAKAPATVTLANLSATFIGTPRVATATTTPAGLNVTITYDGSSTLPAALGSYAVVGTINDNNYVGSASGTLTIAAAPIVPVITSPGSAAGTVGTPFVAYQITATGSPTGYGASGLPAGLAVGSTSGTITGTPTTAGTSVVTIFAQGSAGSGSATLTITVAPAAPATSAPSMTSATSAAGTVGKVFGPYQIAASGSPTSYGATGLPAGLAVNSQTGAITGTPTTAGTSVVTLSATNSTGTGTATLTITVAAAAGGVAPIITSSLTALGTVGTPFSFTITASGSPTSFTATNLPPGLVLNSVTGVISGTPTRDTETFVAIGAANATGTGTATMMITTAPAGVTVAGSYFGTFGNNGGTFALFVRSDRTGVFLGYARGGNIVLVSRDVVIDASGHFRVTLTSAVPTGTTSVADAAAAEPTYVIDGTIAANGSLSGTVSGLNLTFAAPASATSGATAGISGFYEAGSAGSSATSYLVVGAAGDAYVVTVNGSTADAGKGTVNAAGKVAVTTENNAQVAGTIQSQTATHSLTATPAGGTAITYVGGNDDARADVEKLLNISTRGATVSGANVLIAGFVLTGSEPKNVLVRAIGPGLASFGVAGALSAARLEIFSGANRIAVGDDWGSATNAATIAATATRVGAFPLATNSHDAALLLTLNPGAYTAIVSGQNGVSGVSLVEVYDATTGPIPTAQRIINISSRTAVGAGDSTLIGGFVISGTVPKRVLIRGAGPSLAQFGVTGVLARPQLQLFKGGQVIAQNAGWSTSPDAAAIATVSAQTGAFAFAAGSQDAALLISLDPGPYTVQVLGVGGTTGVALVEIFDTQ